MIRKFKATLFLLLTLLLATVIGFSQTLDYHREESPAISWNGVSLFDARLLASGGISLLGSGEFSALSNPAITLESGELAIALSSGLMSYQAFQYWGVNQGVLKAPDGLAENRFLLSGFSLVIPLKNLRVSLGWAVSDILDFPDFDQEQDGWGYSGQFQGKEDRFFLATAFKLKPAIGLGLTLEYVKGIRSVNLMEHYYYEGGYYSLIQQQEQHRSSAIVVSLAGLIKISPRWKLGTVFRYPVYGETDREIVRRFDNNFPSTEIVEEFTASDEMFNPCSLKLAASFSPFQWKDAVSRKSIILAAEGKYVWWSGYEFLFFGESMERAMRNTLVMSLGVEYKRQGAAYDTSVIAGFRLDPQPTEQPLTTLYSFCFGAGLHWKQFRADIAMAYYTGSGGDVSQNHFALCATLKFCIKGD